MLEELRIENFAIIDRLELSFSPGFNVLTGETGAGKSIIVDAVELLLGGKTDATTIRGGQDRAVVEGVFALNPLTQAFVMSVLEREQLLDSSDQDYIVLAREVRSNGRSMARVNGVTVNMDLLTEIGELLVDVHGQSEHLSLLKPRFHIDLLDRYADLLEMRTALATVVNHLYAVRAEISHLLEDEAAIKRRADRLRDELEEIEAAKLRPGEEDELRAERTRLSNSEQLALLTGEITTLLHGEDSSETQIAAVDQLMQVAALLQKLAQIDPTLQSEYELAESVSVQADELAVAMRRYSEGVEFSPQRLNEVEERLEVINALRRRYGATIEAVLEHGERARAELNGIEHSEERLAELREEETELLYHIGELAEKVSKVRQTFGKRMAERIVTELADLRMEQARFEVAITQNDDPQGCFVGNRRLAFDTTGIDQVEFLMTANPGEPVRPLVKVASGGETARIMLALKRVLSGADQTPTLIFDEIDQGIGGRVGAIVGQKLWALSSNHQVLVVTHLPQLAGYADKHYRAMKVIEGNRTRTHVVPLMDEQQRVEELSEMLGAIGESGQQSARDLLIQAQEHKRTAVKAG